jgi:hypothetical protein
MARPKWPIILATAGGAVAVAEYASLHDDWNKCPPNCPGIETTTLPDGTVGGDYSAEA